MNITENIPVYLKKWLRVSEVAKLLSISESTVRNRISAGALPIERFGRYVCIRQSDLEKFLREQRVNRK